MSRLALAVLDDPVQEQVRRETQARLRLVRTAKADIQRSAQIGLFGLHERQLVLADAPLPLRVIDPLL